jgi:hypothetical protein
MNSVKKFTHLVKFPVYDLQLLENEDVRMTLLDIFFVGHMICVNLLLVKSI